LSYCADSRTRLLTYAAFDSFAAVSWRSDSFSYLDNGLVITLSLAS